MYSKKTMAHFLNPCYAGEIENADSVGKAGNPVTGIFIKIWLKLNDGVITGTSFKAAGCVPMIAAGNAAAKLARGLTPDEVMQIKISSVVTEMGGVPSEKRYTVKLALDALKDAIINL
jgi:nitrogen fixation NifU-like protein